MPETKVESIVFTAVTAFFMVYIMTLYHTAINAEKFTNDAFLAAFKGMWLEYLLIFLCAYFLSGRMARNFAFRIVKPTDRPIVIILAIQVFTVCAQVAFASLFSILLHRGDSSDLMPLYLSAYCRNFIMALPVQIFLAGPLARWLFRLLFRRNGVRAGRTEQPSVRADQAK